MIEEGLMIDHGLDIILTIVVLSFWFLFPIGMFLAVSLMEKKSDQLGVSSANINVRKKANDFNRRRPTLIPH